MAVRTLDQSEAARQPIENEALGMKALEILEAELWEAMKAGLKEEGQEPMGEITREIARGAFEAMGQDASEEKIDEVMTKEVEIDDVDIKWNLASLASELRDAWKKHFFQAARNGDVLGADLVPDSFVTAPGQELEDFVANSPMADELSEDLLRKVAAGMAAEVKDRLLAGDSAVFGIVLEDLGDGTFKLNMKA
ncbi:hypothetical protein JKY72_00945 [Candidatus Gracilibacteria bacterium]|nr:hypothetical protein [Candidatus Gracilibacteria bacterium]